jgi:hypothetical protein
LLERSSFLEKWGQEMFGLTLWAEIQTADENSKLDKREE